MKLLRGRPGLQGRIAERLAWHKDRAAPIMGEIARAQAELGYRADIDSLIGGERLKEDSDLALSVLVALADSFDWHLMGSITTLARRRLPYEQIDVELMTALASTGESWHALYKARAALAAIERFAAEHGDESVADAEKQLREVISKHNGSDWTALKVRLQRLTPESVNFDVSSLGGDDPWSKGARSLVERDFRSEGVLLAHLASATQSRPSKKWLDTARPLCTERGSALLRLLLETAVEAEPVESGRFTYEGRTYVQTLWLSDSSAALLRGALWALPLADGDWRVQAAEAMARKAMPQEQLKIANAVWYALGAIADDAAVATLSAFATRIKDKRFLKGVTPALEAAAAKRGMSPGELRESVVPTLGLDGSGTVGLSVGDSAATVTLSPPGVVSTSWQDTNGKTTKSAPAALAERDPDGVKAVKAKAAEIRKELGLQRLRVEELLAADRTWTLEDWRRHYFEHPVVQALARSLIWRFGDVAAIPLAADELLLADGSVLPAAPYGEVRLWHPIHATAAEVAAWRSLIRERQIRQPFKQAFREVYLVAPAEEETGTYSNRFAAHVLRYPQTYALIKQRGWSVVALGPYDNDGGRQWRDFPEQGVQAAFWMDHADLDDMNAWATIASLATTDQVRFTRIGENAPIPIVDVPPLVFSETMRDVDLFVGVTSIAADPNWLDRGPARFHRYWREASFGDLTESAVIRRDLLAEIIPSLKIADRLGLDDRFLVVRGNLRTYRIHLGSGNILVEPNDQYLCIVPDHRPSVGKVFLPFPEDERFNIILSKAFLLAADDRITDRTITQQLRRV